MDKVLNFFRKIAAPFLNQWKNLPLRWKGTIAIALPITAILISSTFAYLGNRARQQIESDIQRKFTLVQSFNEVLNLMVNAETGMRGYQITKRTEFLQPYETAKQELPAKMSALHDLIEAEPGEKPRIEKLALFDEGQTFVNKQMEDLEWQRNYIVKNGEFDQELYRHIIAGKNYMDAIRGILGKMETRESELLSERIEEINAIRKRDYILVFVTLGIAMITRLISWYLFDKGIKGKIQAIVEDLREKRRAGDLGEQTKTEVEALEEEIRLLYMPNGEFNESGSETAQTTK